MSMAKE